MYVRVPVEATKLLMSKLFNWAGNYEYSTDKIYYPKTIEEVQRIIRACKKIKVLGTRHSFNGIGDSNDNLLSLQGLAPKFSLDKKSMSVTVGAGARYGQLSQYLHEHGYALHNLGSLPHISVAGACVSATHGSGVSNGILASAVSKIEFINSEGDVMTLSREKDGENFHGAVVNLGGISVVTNLTLDIQPTFNITQYVYQHLPLEALYGDIDKILSSGYSVSLFTDWKQQNFNQVWIKIKTEENKNDPTLPMSDFFGAKPATKNLHPIIGLPAENCTQQMGIVGPWHERLPHFRMNFTPSSGEELQSEYFVPREYGLKAITAMFELRDQISPYIQISEIRTIDEDKFWMSPCYKQPSLAIHFTWMQNWAAVSKLLPIIEEKLEPFFARPHWAKLFTISPLRLKSLYEKLPDFQKLLTQYDPQGKFRNDFLNRNIF